MCALALITLFALTAPALAGDLIVNTTIGTSMVDVQASFALRQPLQNRLSYGAAFHVGFMEVYNLKNNLLALGVGATWQAILYCLTPLLLIVLTALGLTGLLVVVYNDVVLLPILAGFLMLSGYAIWRQKKKK